MPRYYIEMNRSIVRLSEIVRDIKEESRIEWRFIMLIYLIVICRHESIPTSKDLSSFLLSLHCSSSYFFRYFPYMVFSTAGVLLVKGVSIPTKAHIAI